MTLTLCGVALGGTGGGRISLDHALGIFMPPGWLAFAIAMIVGFGGAAALLITFWRPRDS